MAKTLSIFKPYLHTGILDDGKNEDKVTYLKIPTDITMANFNADVKNGAVQFKELKPLVEKENEPQYILISCDNLEYGYMAVTYLASLFNDKHNERCHSEWDERPDHAPSRFDEWEEHAFAIPVIEEQELQQQMGNNHSTFGFGNVSFMGEQCNRNHKPYWVECTSESVCIVSKGYTPFGFGNGDCTEGLDYFRNNKKVYIINCQEKHILDDFCVMDDIADDEEEEETFMEDASRARWNYAILSFGMDEVNLKITPKQLETYYKMLFQSVFAKYDVITKKGFSYQKLVHLIQAMKEQDKCQLIENIVKYAIKDFPKSASYEITNESFAFMDRFVRTYKKTRNRTAEGSARTRLLQGLIGMDSVKQQVMNVVNVMKFNKMRERMRISGGSYHNVHVMLGAPGTAKTTVAQIMGQIMMEEGLLKDDRYICVNGAELKGKYVGHSAPKTKKIFEEHDVIVIDEAYSLVGDDGEVDIFSKEAIAQLIIELENHSKEKLVIFAGYGGRKVTEKNNKMKAFLDANPGIKSRITSTIYFDSYAPEEMVKIFFHIAGQQNYIVEESVANEVRKHFEKRVMDENFGNGREARSLLETSVIYAASRVFALEKKKYTNLDMRTILAEDVKKAIAEVEESDGIRNVKNTKAIGFIV